MAKNKPVWGYLHRNEGNLRETEPIQLEDDTYTFGRADCNDFTFENNNYLSSKHADIYKDSSGKAWFVDHSSNGSLLNLKEKVHKKKHMLADGDVIHLVYRVNEPDKNVAFKFEYKKPEPKTTASSSVSAQINVFNDTQAYSLDDSIFQDDDDDGKDKKKKEDADVEKKANKRELVEIDSSQESCCGLKDACDTKKLKTKDNKNNDDNNDDKIERKPSPKRPQEDNEITDIILCAICNDIIHNCICLQPCLHSFCAGCYSEWMEKSDDCPICRKKVKRISKNHIVNNIIEAYLKNNPHKKRSDEELKQLDEKTAITKDMLYPKKGEHKKAKKAANDDNEDEESDSDSDSDDNYEGSIFNSDHERDDYNSDNDEDDDDYEPANYRHRPHLAFGLGNFGAAAAAVARPFQFRCRQCPENKWLIRRDAQPQNDAPDYTCTPQQNHLLCQCCLEAFPDRGGDMARDPLLPKQSCSMCMKSFCNLYWGCRRAGCRRCLARFADLNVDAIDCVAESVISENAFESQLFADWLKRTHTTLAQVFDECKRKLLNREYQMDSVPVDQVLDKVVCRQCGIKLLRELVYQYRRDLPRDQFGSMFT